MSCERGEIHFTVKSQLIPLFVGARLYSEEQRDYYATKMRAMARSGHDDEDGWRFFGKTIQVGVPEDEQLDVYARDVEWSAASQLRSCVEASFGVETVFDSVFTGFHNDMYGKEDVNHSHKAAKALKITVEYEFAHLFMAKAEDRSSLTALYYRDVNFPWCVYVAMLRVSLACSW